MQETVQYQVIIAFHVNVVETRYLYYFFGEETYLLGRFDLQLRNVGKELKKGDVLLSNHPKAGGSHLPDLTVITPVFYEYVTRSTASHSGLK